MTLEQYFAQDKYFSESMQELVDLDSIPYQHAYHAANKLYSEHGDAFIESRLGEAFRERLSPSAQNLAEQLRRYGKATLAYRSGARARLHYAAKKIGARVTTHKERTWVTATVIQDVKVRVRGEEWLPDEC